MNDRIQVGPGGQQPLPQLGAIIAARLDSRRFPGKVLHPLLGRPILGHVIQRCRQVAAIQNSIVVATTSRPLDHPIAKFCAGQDVGVFRGGTEDVARRLLDCALALGWDGFFRINADSPCLDPNLLTQAAAAFAGGAYDLVTNLHPRSFPYGVSVELIRTSALAAAARRFERPDHREHVTLYCYEHPTEFRIHNLTNPDPETPLPRLTVDTPEDLVAVEAYLAGSTPAAVTVAPPAVNGSRSRARSPRSAPSQSRPVMA